MKDFIRRHWDEILGVISIVLIGLDFYNQGRLLLGIGLILGGIAVLNILRSTVEIRLKQRNREET